MAWVSRGLRGSTLEELVNRTNEQYAVKKTGTDTEDPYSHYACSYGQRSSPDHSGVF